jgi:hypothetical protein
VREPRVYTGHDMPEVEVLIDGVWYFGDLRAWTPVGETGWQATVSYNVSPGEWRVDQFPAERVRKAEEGGSTTHG